MVDPIKFLLAAAVEDQKELSFWLGIRMGELVHELEEAGLEIEDIPKALTDYAAWLLANLDLFRD